MIVHLQTLMACLLLATSWESSKIDVPSRNDQLFQEPSLVKTNTQGTSTDDIFTPEKPEKPGLPEPPQAAEQIQEEETDFAESETEDPDSSLLNAQELRELEFQHHLNRAKQLEREGRVDEAIREYSAALKLQRGDPEALRARAHLRIKKHNSSQCPKQAIEEIKLLRMYDPQGSWLTERGTLVDWMERCGPRYRLERFTLALELAEEDPSTPGRPVDVRLAVAKHYVEDAKKTQSSQERNSLQDAALRQIHLYRQELVKIKQIPEAYAFQLQAELLQEKGNVIDAIVAYQELIHEYPALEIAKAAQTKVAELQLQLELERLEKEQGGRPSPIAEASVQRAQEALQNKDFVQAKYELNKAITDSPWFPKAYYTLGLVYAQTGEYTQAVDKLKMAIRMDRFNYNAHTSLGMIYKNNFAGAEDEAAIEHFEQALRLRPDLHYLRFLLGELYARTDRMQAIYHYQQFLEKTPRNDPKYQTAQQALESLQYEVNVVEPNAPPEPPSDLRKLDPALQRMINEAYLRVGDEGDWEQAERILQRARVQFPNEVIVLNELAKVVFAENRPGDARQFWEQSLKMKEDQVEVHERLGILLTNDLPKEAIPHLERAAELGSLTSRYLLAELLWKKWDVFAAAKQLEQYLQAAGEYDLYWDYAQELHQQIEQKILQIYIGLGLFLALISMVIAWQIYRRFRGASLKQLLVRAPKSSPEVARILSLIRHEILKHNTAFLADVGQALATNDSQAESRVVVIAKRLFGTNTATWQSNKNRLEGGVYRQFLSYIEELQKIGRAHGVPLNLQRKDLIFRSMIRSFAELRILLTNKSLAQLTHTENKYELAKKLQYHGKILGHEAFEYLSSLIHSLCVVEVDEALILSAYHQVCTEPQFENAQLDPVRISGKGALIRIFATDLMDVLSNVIRNSLHSSILFAPKPVQLEIELRTEVDDITGHSSLAIRIKDQSMEPLSNEMLRGRYVERGMGITVDLLSRYDGSIAVEAEENWQKAVVIRFFTVEQESS